MGSSGTARPSCVALTLIGALLCGRSGQAAAQTAPKVFYACYVPLTGTVYRVNEPDLKPTCTSASHVLFSWTDGANAVRSTDVAGGDAAGTFSSLLVRGLQGRPIASTAPANGQFLGFDGTVWKPSTLPSAGLPTAASGAFDFSNPNGFIAEGTGPTAVLPSGVGTRLFWYPGKSAFRAGRATVTVPDAWDEPNIGIGSIGLGNSTMASGQDAFAAGRFSSATGDAAIAIGVQGTASGNSSIALGQSTASGVFAVSIGNSTTASGRASVAIGTDASTNGKTGAIVFSDFSGTDFLATASNEFAARAAGGFRFRTSASLATGCNLPSGSGTWDCTSSRYTKEGFKSLRGEDVLTKIARMPIQSWTYRTDPTHARHVGPTAQDFREAFGLGTGDTSISLVDIDGINLLGVQTLAQRTESIGRENAELRKRVARTEQENAELRARMEKIEKLLQRSQKP